MPKKPSPEKQKEYQQRYKSKPGIKEKYAALNKQWIENNREKYNAAKSLYRFKLKIAALNYYSNGTMSCAKCGYSSDIDALCLDHINDDGAQHRKELNVSSRGVISGTTIYERLKAKGWMEGLQVLCFNCNSIKEFQRKRGFDSKKMLEKIVDPINWGGNPRNKK